MDILHLECPALGPWCLLGKWWELFLGPVQKRAFLVFQNIVSYLEVVLKGHLILCFTHSGLQLSLSGSRLGFYKIEDGIKKHQRAGREALCCFKDTYCSVTVDRGPTTRPFSMAEARMSFLKPWVCQFPTLKLSVLSCFCYHFKKETKNLPQHLSRGHKVLRIQPLPSSGFMPSSSPEFTPSLWRYTPCLECSTPAPSIC